MNTIARRSTRIIKALKVRLTQCKMYDSDTGDWRDVEPAAAWHSLYAYDSARLWKSSDGEKYTVHVHSNLFYELTAPTEETPAPAAVETSAVEAPVDVAPPATPADETPEQPAAPAVDPVTNPADDGRRFRDVMDSITRSNNGSGLALMIRRAAELWPAADKEGAPLELHEIMATASGTTHLDTLTALARRAGEIWDGDEAPATAQDAPQDAPQDTGRTETVPAPLVRLEADEDTRRSYYVRAAHQVLGGRGNADDDDFAMVLDRKEPRTVLVAHLHRGRCSQSTKRGREHRANRDRWAVLLEAAGFTVTRRIMCSVLATAPAAPAVRVELHTTGLPGETVTAVQFPDYGVGGTITQITTYASMGYAVQSSTGRAVPVGQSGIDQSVACLAHHWSLPLDNFAITRTDDHPVRTAASKETAVSQPDDPETTPETETPMTEQSAPQQPENPEEYRGFTRVDVARAADVAIETLSAADRAMVREQPSSVILGIAFRRAKAAWLTAGPARTAEEGDAYRRAADIASAAMHFELADDPEAAHAAIVEHGRIVAEERDAARADQPATPSKENTVSQPYDPATSLRNTFHRFSMTLAELATSRRPKHEGGPGDGSVTLAIACRTASVMFADVRDALDVRAPWLRDREQVLAYLTRAAELANEGGFHINKPRELAEWIADFMARPTA